MRIGFPVLFIFLLMGFSVKSQYFYKDILLSRQNQDNWKLYHDHRVKAVDIQSIDANDEKTEGFTCTQTISPDFSSISTFTKS
ncbi:MAG: hypothetical protein M3N30_14160, partial [Bacteroidota bacterium]|nr:hypothetical protein [Bacteroidota bacterium]